MGAGDGVGNETNALGVESSAEIHFAATPRPRSLLYAIVGVIVVESLAVHALIYKRWPLASVALLVLNVWSLWYLWREFSAGARIVVTPDALDVHSGRSLQVHVPRDRIRSARRPEWRDLPEANSKGYLKIAGGDDPNVLLTFDPPASVQLPLGIRRPVTTLGLHLTDPDRLVTALSERAGNTSRHAAIHK